MNIIKDYDEVYEIVIVGAGPAGLSAGIVAGELGAQTVIIDENPIPGGQLIKQTHKFFGSKELYCGIRGIDIPRLLVKNLQSGKVKLKLNTSVIGYFKGNVLGVVTNGKFLKIYGKRIIFATGAYENPLPFPNHDLPGVYGAGAVQTLMNVHGVLPGRRALMVGSGNIGLIVSYQLVQAGVEVVAVVEITQNISGWHVHAAKLRRLGVPILVSHTIKCAFGKNSVEEVVIVKVDKKLRPIRGSEKRFKVDMICLAVGLSPLTELVSQAGCKIIYIPELGGYLPWHNDFCETSNSTIFVCGDLAGIEEASTAILEGRIAGARAYQSLYGIDPKSNKIITEAQEMLSEFRSGSYGKKILRGKQILKDHLFYETG
ncbi:MAG: NAD(P)/FAD-dependent oxidoreductase [candidate division WOR-3 bacterium]